MVVKKSLEKDFKGGKNEEENLRLIEPLTFAVQKIYQHASKFKPYRFSINLLPLFFINFK